jgi:CzcA family heavy metal efflux pump
MKSVIGKFAVRHAVSIVFLVLALCLAGAHAARRMGSSVFPKTEFPRVVIMVDNGVKPADEMMAAVTRPIEEAMKDIPGSETIRSTTGRGSAQIDLFFSWKVDMLQTELAVRSRLAQVMSQLPPTAHAEAWRMNFSTFQIVGVSLTAKGRDISSLWELARYDVKPKFLRLPGVARVELVGGQAPEYQVIVDPMRLAALRLPLSQVTETLNRNNFISGSGLHQEDNTLFLTVVDGRVHSVEDIENLTVNSDNGQPVRLKDFARVLRGKEPVFNAVTADGVDAVLINIFSQPDASTVDIVRQLQEQLPAIRAGLPPDVKLAFFYDQSLLVRDSMRSAWEAIIFGLILSVAILYLFLRSWGTTLVAIVVIPVTVLLTILAMSLSGMNFDLMTLGGIAAAIGLVIDDAIVVVEAIYAKIAAGMGRLQAIPAGIEEIFSALLGSTLTPVVVFLPLAFLDGVVGVFFRALALTMTVALLTSLLMALTLTPALAAWILRLPAKRISHDPRAVEQGGFILRRVIRLYESILRVALDRRKFTVAFGVLVLAVAVILYPRLKSDFLPEMDEGGFVIDYVTPPGTSLAETDRQMRQAEEILKATPEIESYSRRTGAALGVHLVELNTGDFLIKLKPDRKRSTAAVVDDLRKKFHEALPRVDWDFPGILSDLIGDLIWSDKPIEVKIFSNDLNFLTRKAEEIEELITPEPRARAGVAGVVDVFNGLVYTGNSIHLRVRLPEAQRFGLNADDIASAVNTAMLGQTASTVLEGDRVVNIRVALKPFAVARFADLRNLPLRAANGVTVQLSQVADIVESPGELELHREDMRQNIAVTARLDGRDLGSAMKEIRRLISRDPSLSSDNVEYGGLYQQQEESFHDLLIVLGMAIVLVFTVALLEFRSFTAPLAIVFGAVLSGFGIVLALIITGTTLSIITYLGAIIGMGIVHKNGILMLDYVEQLRERGVDLREALVQSGRRRLRPVLMTSMAAGLGMLPLAWGIGPGADMLRPLAIAVIGALCTSVLLSLVATPAAYFALQQFKDAWLFQRWKSGNSNTTSIIGS